MSFRIKVYATCSVLILSTQSPANQARAAKTGIGTVVLDAGNFHLKAGGRPRKVGIYSQVLSSRCDLATIQDLSGKGRTVTADIRSQHYRKKTHFEWSLRACLDFSAGHLLCSNYNHRATGLCGFCDCNTTEVHPDSSNKSESKENIAGYSLKYTSTNIFVNYRA